MRPANLDRHRPSPGRTGGSVGLGGRSDLVRALGDELRAGGEAGLHDVLDAGGDELQVGLDVLPQAVAVLVELALRLLDVALELLLVALEGPLDLGAGLLGLALDLRARGLATAFDLLEATLRLRAVGVRLDDAADTVAGLERGADLEVERAAGEVLDLRDARLRGLRGASGAGLRPRVGARSLGALAARALPGARRLTTSGARRLGGGGLGGRTVVGRPVVGAAARGALAVGGVGHVGPPSHTNTWSGSSLAGTLVRKPLCDQRYTSRQADSSCGGRVRRSHRSGCSSSSAVGSISGPRQTSLRRSIPPSATTASQNAFPILYWRIFISRPSSFWSRRPAPEADRRRSSSASRSCGREGRTSSPTASMTCSACPSTTAMAAWTRSSVSRSSGWVTSEMTSPRRRWPIASLIASALGNFSAREASIRTSAAASSVFTCSPRYSWSHGTPANCTAWVTSWSATQRTNSSSGTSSVRTVSSRLGRTNSRRGARVSAGSSRTSSYCPSTRWAMKPMRTPTSAVIAMPAAMRIAGLSGPEPVPALARTGSSRTCMPERLAFTHSARETPSGGGTVRTGSSRV